MYDYGGDEEQRRRRALGTPDAGPAYSASPGGVAPTSVAGGYAPGGGLTDAAPGAKHGTGYVNLQTYLGANYGAGQGMAQHVAGETARQGDAERAALKGLAAGQMVPGALAGQAQDTAARARLAGPAGGGLGAVLAKDYGGGQTPYTSGMQGFDAFLAGGAGGQTLAQSANQYAGLGGEVDAINKAAAEHAPPAEGKGKGFGGRSPPPAASPVGFQPEVVPPNGVGTEDPAGILMQMGINGAGYGAVLPWFARKIGGHH